MHEFQVTSSMNGIQLKGYISNLLDKDVVQETYIQCNINAWKGSILLWAKFSLRVNLLKLNCSAISLKWYAHHYVTVYVEPKKNSAVHINT